ncbi:hypothetical protein HK097_001197 [Rhizophlyctis rosea]|uniref:Uncharacterized protein n=1 Tax=Rhizophlyctis rosea TaxID=64517 RepID=A0AAD5WZ20_9FUNG|nr:hypothetical protein HK097_001197 [Rhizophlyctis rosea]
MRIINLLPLALALPLALSQPAPSTDEIQAAGPGDGPPPPAGAPPAPPAFPPPAAVPPGGVPPGPGVGAPPAPPAPGAGMGAPPAGGPPVNPEGGDGLPDFVPDADHLTATLTLDYIDAGADPCLIKENCLQGNGTRTIIRFGTMVHNTGTADAYLGEPPHVIDAEANPPYWNWDTCHGHWHFNAYANYALLNAGGDEVLAGHKNGFCLEDVGCDAPGMQPYYDCTNQGVTAGCFDLYDQTLACQWIDVTDLINGEGYTPETQYTLRVHMNPENFFPELNYDNNIAEVPVVIGDLPMYDGPDVVAPVPDPNPPPNAPPRDAPATAAEAPAAEPGPVPDA